VESLISAAEDLVAMSAQEPETSIPDASVHDIRVSVDVDATKEAESVGSAEIQNVEGPQQKKSRVGGLLLDLHALSRVE